MGNERVMVRHGYVNLNDNGERLMHLCGMNSLVIEGTLFPQKDIHKISWNSPNRREKSQIDHRPLEILHDIGGTLMYQSSRMIYQGISSV